MMESTSGFANTACDGVDDGSAMRALSSPPGVWPRERLPLGLPGLLLGLLGLALCTPRNDRVGLRGLRCLFRV